ncbi:hypothetical protein SAMN04244560_00360 [Thermoanaerobacter thermohydrosulfuricus]|uniref:Uncharacterized protein n=1 Tax=Thermoanaerobacter thermohydrosulfuricus TaxID=1516 RepID=A0A1G7IY43_THETY|nr:hypothetical protein [Thermoanaerobacter thermohydrosulfuricus]SDF17474.1 hypothetical protein SAMN04244560_00360 [Thermoanaerobacter thermohydrosulfuricus]
MKQNKKLIYMPQYEPDIKQMVTALQILLEYEPNNKKEREFILSPKFIELIKKSNP